MADKRAQQGFGVVEAISAVALIAVAFIPLMVLQGQMARTAAAVQRVEASATARTTSLGFLQTLNPIARPTGSMDIGEAEMSWRARSLQPRTSVRQGPTGFTSFDVELFIVDVSIDYDDGRRETFSVQKVGWIKNRN